jgi:hypothetical protein
LFFPSLEAIATAVEVEHFEVATDLASDDANRIFGFRKPFDDLPLLRDLQLKALPTWKPWTLLQSNGRQDRQTTFAISQSGWE